MSQVPEFRTFGQRVGGRRVSLNDLSVMRFDMRWWTNSVLGRPRRHQNFVGHKTIIGRTPKEYIPGHERSE
jgi:hypothetical protein